MDLTAIQYLIMGLPYLVIVGLLWGIQNKDKSPVKEIPLAVIKLAKIVDTIRLIPRLILVGYGILVYNISVWAMSNLKDPVAQAAFVSTIIGAIPFIMKFYMQNRKDWNQDADTTVPPELPKG